jgi:hypothetical protein
MRGPAGRFRQLNLFWQWWCPMTQLAINFEPPPLAQARAVGQVASELAQDRAERKQPDFSERAKAHILAELERLGTASGEYLTDSCTLAGIVGAGDGRAFGGVFGGLARAGRIKCLRADLPRARGHGTSGGKLWGLA